MRSSTVMLILRVLIIAVSLPFIWQNIWAYLPYKIESFSHFLAIPWDEIGEVAFSSRRFVGVIWVDLFFGWALSSIFVVMLERAMGHSWLRVLLWIIPLNFIGNIVLALYLLLYLEQFRDRILGDPRPSTSVRDS